MVGTRVVGTHLQQRMQVRADLLPLLLLLCLAFVLCLDVLFR